MMMWLLDRLMIRSYVKSYFICLVSLLGLYIVVDLFMNVADFAHVNDGLLPFLKHIGKYYAARSTTIFDRLSEMIVLLAAMFTIAWVQRNNELLPQLSAGVSTKRVVKPVLVAACFMITLATLNQELLIPQFSYLLSLNRDDVNGDRLMQVHSGYEPNGICIWGGSATRKDMVVRDFSCSIKLLTGAANIVNLQAKEAHYIPPADDQPRTGGWMLTGTKAPSLDNWTRTDILEQISPTKFFLKTQEVDFDVVTRDQNKWFYLASTWRIFEELGKPYMVERMPPMAVMFHMRLTRPILGMILVFLGLSVILRDQNRNVFISAGLCLLLCAAFFAAGFASQQLGNKELVSPALAAWLPVLIFGPLAFVMFDAIHT